MSWRAILENEAEPFSENNPYTQYPLNTQKAESYYKKVSTKEPLADSADIAYRDQKNKNASDKGFDFDFNSAPLQRTKRLKDLPKEEVQHIMVQKMETCLHGERCPHLNNQNQCKKVNVSVFNLEACPLPKSKWFKVQH